jgi:acetyl esterase/lipase
VAPTTGLTRREALAVGGSSVLVLALAACGSDGGRTSDARRDDEEPLVAIPLHYGEHPAQVADLYAPTDRPDGSPPERDGRLPVVVLVHGGFWQAGYDRTLMDPLVTDLTARGWPVLNVDHRSVGDDGGWPGTFEDLGAAVDLLATHPAAADASVDPRRVVVVGHSAGGHLALWSAARSGLPEGAPGAAPAVVPIGVVGQAAVCDLVTGAAANLGEGACQSLLSGAPTDVPERYTLASPAARLPLGVPTVLVHGTGDDVVPKDQSEQYAEQAQAAGDDVQLELVQAGHVDHLDPTSRAWQAVVDSLPSLVAQPL